MKKTLPRGSLLPVFFTPENLLGVVFPDNFPVLRFFQLRLDLVRIIFFENIFERADLARKRGVSFFNTFRPLARVGKFYSL